MAHVSFCCHFLSLQMCGNGIVETGEDCDPGVGIESPCCDAATCKFRTGAVCDPRSSLCCTDQCTFAPSSKVCRVSKDSRCDMEERCTGTSDGNASVDETDVFPFMSPKLNRRTDALSARIFTVSPTEFI